MRMAIFYAGCFGLYFFALGVFFLPFETSDLAIFAISYLVRMFCLVGVMHRYFAHRSYKMKRWFRFMVTAFGCLAVQKGPLWWSYTHMIHHRYSDSDDDIHSPWVQGYWLAQLKWLFEPSTWKMDISTYINQLKKS